MIVTPEHLIKKYFPEPVETTRELYKRLEFDEAVYPYINWVNDAEKYCLSRYVDSSEYRLLPDEEKNIWLSPKAFRVLIETSPSRIGDEIRACVSEIAHKVATDRNFARLLQDQLDREAGLEEAVPKVSKSLKAKYNTTGKDAFEFTVNANNRIYLDILSGYDFRPGQKIREAVFNFKLHLEDGVPFHIVDMMLTLNNNDILSYRTIWSLASEQKRYAAIFVNRFIRINLFGDNRKLVDSYDYMMNPDELKVMENEIEKALGAMLESNLEGIDIGELGEKVLNRHNLNDQAYALAIKEAIPVVAEFRVREMAELVDEAFVKAIDQYWENYVLQPDPTGVLKEDLDQMAKERVPRVVLGLTVAEMFYYNDLCDKYFKRRFNQKQRQVLISDSPIRLIYSLAGTNEFDPAADSQKRIADMCAFIIDYLEMVEQMYIQMGQWPK